MDITISLKDLLDLLQTGLILTAYIGFYYTTKEFKEQRLSRKAEFRMKIDDKYQNIMKATIDNPELSRINIHLPHKNIIITQEEKYHTIQKINNIHMLYDVWMLKQIDITEGMEKDIANWFSYTIPSMVWNEVKPYQGDAFVEYIEGLFQKY